MSREELQRDMAEVVFELIGDGYVPDYYHQLAVEFVEVAIAHGAVSAQPTTDREEPVHTMPLPRNYYMGGHGDPVPFNFDVAMLELHEDGTVTWRKPDPIPTDE